MRVVGSSPGERGKILLLALVLLLLLGFLSGIFVADIGRVVGALGMLFLIHLARVGPGTEERGTEPELPPWTQWPLWAAVALLWLEVTLHLLARIVLGEHGIDFAIFSQAIAGIGREGIPWVSLVSGEPRNFLTHHFAPILYVPGALARLGLHPTTAGVLVHVAGLLLALVSVYRVSRTVGVSRIAGVWLLTAAAFTASIRAPYQWTMNDEMYGAPFVVLGLWMWLAGRYAPAAIAFAISCLCKESFPLVTVAFVFVALYWHDDFRPAEEKVRARRVFVPLGIAALALFVGYVFLQPLFLAKGFDHANKLVGLDALFAPQMLGKKALYVLTLLLPTLALPLLFDKGRKLLVIALPGVGLSLVSGFDEMYRPHNYYAVTPVLVSYVAFAACFPALQRRWGRQAASVALLVMVLASLSIPSAAMARTLKRALTLPWRSPSQLAFVPREARVAVDPAAAALLVTEHRNLVRIWGIAEAKAGWPYDWLIWKEGGYETPSPAMLEETVDCGSTPLWLVRCRKGMGGISQ